MEGAVESLHHAPAKANKPSPHSVNSREQELVPYSVINILGGHRALSFHFMLGESLFPLLECEATASVDSFVGVQIYTLRKVILA